ncbi:helix-turn-helix domain-containing protein [Marinobacter sp.]|uniref:helix-turn-helix domain-containing protein n=1 Tax=Marinobacter sp. TaxID=50741 RepID=UPI003A8F711C
MSVKVSSLVWDNFPHGGSKMLCMLAMADWSNDAGGSIHPSIATLARKMRTSESQARRVLHGLIDEGYVSVVGNEFGGAPGATRLYQICMEAIAAPRTDATPSAHATPSTDAQRRVAPMRETGSTHATQTVSEPLYEPPLVVSLLCKDGTEFQAPADFVKEMVALHPGKNIPDQFMAMRNWLVSNPGKRKTQAGMKRFIGGWLSRQSTKAQTSNVYTADNYRQPVRKLFPGINHAPAPTGTGGEL